MAICEGPALSLRASGNVGTLCYTTWRGLSVVKDAWTGTVPNTSKQLVLQGYMTTVSQAWGGLLTPAERASWERRATSVVWQGRFGRPYVPNGYQLFIKWNMRRKLMGLTIMQKAPAEQERVYIDNLRCTVHSSEPATLLWLMKSAYVVIDGYGIEYYKAGPYDSGGRKPIAGEWLFRSRKVPPDYLVDYNVIPGKWYWYRARAITEFGDVSNWFQKQVKYIAP